MNQTPTATHSVEAEGAGVHALVKMLQVLFIGLRVLIIGIFVWLIFSGVFKVDEQEEALLFRFGELQTKTLDPTQGPTAVLTSGHWYWAWPYPIDAVKIIPAQRSVSVSTESVFWPQINPNQLDTPDPALLQNQPLRPGQDGYLLTGDTNIMHVVWNLTYRVTDAQRYYLDIFDDSEAPDQVDGEPVPKKGPEAIIRNLLANAALKEMGTWSVEDVLRTSRADPENPAVRTDLTDAVRDRVEAALEQTDVGIQVQQVSLVELQPPSATLQAFRQVVDAATVQRVLIDQSEQYEATVVPEAEGEAYRILDQAKAYRTRVVERIKAEGAYFESVNKEYKKNPETMLVALYSDAIREVLERVETKYIIHADEHGDQEIRLQLGPEPEPPGRNRPGQNAN